MALKKNNPGCDCCGVSGNRVLCWDVGRAVPFDHNSDGDYDISDCKPIGDHRVNWTNFEDFANVIGPSLVDHVTGVYFNDDGLRGGPFTPPFIFSENYVSIYGEPSGPVVSFDPDNSPYWTGNIDDYKLVFFDYPRADYDLSAFPESQHPELEGCADSLWTAGGYPIWWNRIKTSALGTNANPWRGRIVVTCNFDIVGSSSPVFMQVDAFVNLLMEEMGSSLRTTLATNALPDTWREGTIEDDHLMTHSDGTRFDFWPHASSGGVRDASLETRLTSTLCRSDISPFLPLMRHLELNTVDVLLVSLQGFMYELSWEESLEFDELTEEAKDIVRQFWRNLYNVPAPSGS